MPEIPGWIIRSHNIEQPRSRTRVHRSIEVRAGRLLGLGPLTLGTRAQLIDDLEGSDAVLCLFDEAAFLYRTRFPIRRPTVGLGAVLVRSVEALSRLGSAGRFVAGRMLDPFDVLFVYSPDQVALMDEVLGRTARGRVRYAPFGIDTTYWAPTDAGQARSTGRPGREVRVVAAGRDQGRDYSTLFTAVSPPIPGVMVRLICRESNLRGLVVPDEVEYLGFLARDDYRQEIAEADIVVVPTKDLAYPTGQTVVLHAMSLGVPVIVTGTDSIRSFLGGGAPVVYVEAGNGPALRDAIVALAADEARRERLTTGGRELAVSRFDHTRTFQTMLRHMEAFTDRRI